MIKLKPPYSVFAKVYNKTMQEIPYHQWAYYIYQVFDENQLGEDDWIADIGAGTGIIASKLGLYYRLIAVDYSSDMLSSAKTYHDFRRIQADMRDLPFQNEVLSAAYSTHDCLNYLTTEIDLRIHLEQIYNALKPGGIYIFDYSTEYNVIRYFDNKVFKEKHGNLSMKWSNKYDHDEKIITSTIDVTEYLSPRYGILLFWKKNKFRETHKQKVFTEEILEGLCIDTGFSIISKKYDYSENMSSEHAHIAVYILKKIISNHAYK